MSLLAQLEMHIFLEKVVNGISCDELLMMFKVENPALNVKTVIYMHEKIDCKQVHSHKLGLIS